MSHQSELIASDILEYLKQHENKDMLRFITCGNVDDGKSTLIGRLLHDSKLIFEDQLAAIERDSKKYNTTDQEIDLALLVDGLQAERARHHHRRGLPLLQHRKAQVHHCRLPGARAVHP
jgi:predicted GTPase